MSRRYGYRNRYPIGREHLNNRTSRVPIVDTKALDTVARENGYIKPSECPSCPNMTVEDEIYTTVTNIPPSNEWYMYINEIRTFINGELYVLNRVVTTPSLIPYIYYSSIWYPVDNSFYIARYTASQYYAVSISSDPSDCLITNSGDGTWLKVVNSTEVTLAVTLEYVKYTAVVDL